MPGDAAAVVVAGPQKPLFEKESSCWTIYLAKDRGGCCCCSTPSKGAELKPLLAKYGLALEDNVVVEVDPLSRFMGGNYFMPVVAKYPEHAITKNFGFATMFPLARGLAASPRLPSRRHA